MQTSATPRLSEPEVPLPFWHQFRFNLILAFIILAVLPLIAVAILTISQQVNQTQAQTNRQLESIVELKNGQINLWLNESVRALDYILGDRAFRQSLATVVVERDGMATATLEALNGRIGALVQPNTYFERFIVYGRDGEIVLASSANDLGKLVQLQPYFAPSLNQATYIQPPFFNVGTTQLTMITTRQLQDENGQVVGIFAGQMNLDVLGRIMTERTGLVETGETYLVSQQNNYLLTPSRFEGYASERSYRSQAIDNTLQGQSGNGIYENYQSPPARVIGVYRWIPELEAGLIAEVNEAQVLVGARQSQVNTILLGVAVAVIAIIGGFFYAARISRPVALLTTIAKQFAQGKFEVRADIRSRNEMGLLANTFNRMAEGIEANQAELTELNQTLEKRVTERSIQLREARDEALAAQRIAQENSRLKSEFLSTMSHELRTPLNAIHGFTSVLLGGMGVELSPRAEDMVKRISSNSKRLLQLINDFLDLSRIEAGRLDLVKTALSPEALASKWENQVSVLGASHDIEFEVKVDPELPPLVWGDEDALSKVAINLLSNAFKFTPQGRVTLELQRVQQGWTISVTDTGIGIPSHARDYIFEEFRQVDNSSKRLHGGTGLGLALVQKLTRAMGGTVALQSQIGVGSIFTVTLPLEAAEGTRERVTA